jgi:hypothetical protein
MLATMPNLIDLPSEVLENVLSFLDASDTALFGCTCRQARDLTNPTNQLLWRHAFLRVYDDPAESLMRYPKSFQDNVLSPDWYAELRSRTTAVSTLADMKSPQSCLEVYIHVR